MATVEKVDFTHYDYDRLYSVWEKCRIVSEGSEAVKAAGEMFLPSLKKQQTEDYEKYKHRALFFEGTGRTVMGLVGIMFAKDPIIKGLENDEFLNDIVLEHSSFIPFVKKVAEEVIIVGRTGLLVDADEGGNPYITNYKAEDIINWRTQMVEGQQVLSYVVLREMQEIYKGFETDIMELYRVLMLDEEGKYTQELYVRDKQNKKKFHLMPGFPMKPVIRGKALDSIPFYFLNVRGVGPDVENPPLTGLVNANIAHYMNSADLEHGRHFTGLPTPWVAGFADPDDKSLCIGSHEAWVSNKPEAKAGFLEFTGQGLTSLENGIKEKQEAMVVLGARLLEAPKNASESAENQLTRKFGESSILSNIASSISKGLTDAVQFAAEWSNKNKEKYSIEIIADTSMVQADSSVIQQLMAAWQGGLISYNTFFINMKRFGIIPSERTEEEEQAKIAEEEAGRGFGGAMPLGEDDDEEEEKAKPFENKKEEDNKNKG